jgi:hypothetical protein
MKKNEKKLFVIYVALAGLFFLILKSKQIIHITCFNLFIGHFR